MASRPRIRLVHLPDAVVAPSPVPVNGSSDAFDFALRREGWIAFGGFTVWGMPVPLEGEPFKVGRSFGFLRSENPRAIWVTDGHRSYEEGQTFLEYDGGARTVLNRVELPPGYRMFDARGDDAFVRDEHGGEWRLDRAGGRFERITYDDVPALPGERRLAAGREWAFVDDKGRSTRVDPLPQGRPRPSEFGSFSPDWRYFAVDVDLSDRNRALPSMIDIAQGKVRYEPVAHRLAIIDCVNGSVAVAEGTFDGVASQFVWSFDSEWVVFGTPFAPRGVWACSVHDLKLEWIDFGRRNAPSPLVNVSDLVHRSGECPAYGGRDAARRGAESAPAADAAPGLSDADAADLGHDAEPSSLPPAVIRADGSVLPPSLSAVELAQVVSLSGPRRSGDATAMRRRGLASRSVVVDPRSDQEHRAESQEARHDERPEADAVEELIRDPS